MKLLRRFCKLSFFTSMLGWALICSAEEPEEVLTREKAMRDISPQGQKQFISLVKDGDEILVPVALAERQYIIERVQHGKTVRTDWFTQFEIKSVGRSVFLWSIWEPSVNAPREFKIFPAGKGKTFVTYQTQEELHILSITQSNEAVSALETALESFYKRRFFDVSPSIPIKETEPLNLSNLIKANVDAFKSKTGPMNALYTPVFVERIFDKEGDLHLVLHGIDSKRKFAFAFRDGKWIELK